MPTPPDHRDDTKTSPLPTDALAPMFGLARRAQAAIADAAVDEAEAARHTAPLPLAGSGRGWGAAISSSSPSS